MDDAEEPEERDQNGAGYQVPDELLEMMAPETVPTPIFDNDEVRISARKGMLCPFTNIGPTPVMPPTAAKPCAAL